MTVNQTLTSITVSPSSASLGSHQTEQFAAMAYDQFGNAIASQPSIGWSVASGVGSISTGGLYTAPYSCGAATATATGGGLTSSSVAIAVTDAAPSIAIAATASPATVTATTTRLNVLGADSDGGGESNLSYTWAATGGSAAVSFSANGTNSAKNDTAQFSKAGNYQFTVTITDLGGQSTTSTVNVTVNQTLTGISVSPSTPSLTSAGTHQFSAAAVDQFGNAITNQPAITWSLIGAGSLIGGGFYMPPYATGLATVQAIGGGACPRRPAGLATRRPARRS